MVLNYIWIGFFLIALLVAIIKTFNGDLEVFSNIVNSTFDMAETSFEISIGLTGVLCLWLGIMNIGEKGGTVQVLSKLVGPFFSKLFPDVPEDHPARGSMLMNFSANMLGLDNAATPMGLKAMTELQELNPKKDTASNAQIMFLVLNTSGLTLIPITVMNYRNQYDAVNPSDVFIPILICTFFASLVGLIVVSIYQKINLFNKVVLSYLVGLTAIIAGMLWYFTSLSSDDLQSQSSLVSNIILYGIICIFIIMALVKKVNVYESFIEGAKGGFEIAIKIIPYLVAILVSIGVFRASGAMDYMTNGLECFFGLFLENTDFVKALPTAFMKPLSGTGARGMMLDAFDAHGVDSFIARLSATFQGATDTTFYIIAVYFGSVGIKKTRYAIKAGLLADLAGIVAAVFVATLFFGDQTTTNYTPTEIVHNFTIEWNSNHQSQFLSDDFTFTDQTYDEHSLEQMALDIPEFKETHIFEKEIDEKSVIFYKSTINNTTNSFKFIIGKQKIQSIQLMGNFED